jgi:hypothetical protein
VNTSPRWEVPPTYGYAAAVESMGSVAAPVLAGFSLAVAVFLVEGHETAGWTSAALILLVFAALAFIAAMQFTFHARRFAVTPPEIEMWWPDADNADRRTQLSREQRGDYARHRSWATWAGRAYDAGMVAFLLGTTAALMPPGGLADASAGRILVCAFGAVGVVAEIAWIIRTRKESGRAG